MRSATLPERFGNCCVPAMSKGQQTSDLGPQRHLPSLAEPCLDCGYGFLSPSKPKGFEEFLEVIGVEFYRCHQCKARYVRCFGRIMRTRTPHDRPYVSVFTAVGLGVVLCGALAIGVLKLTHRWPL
jgi:hypothetical protein